MHYLTNWFALSVQLLDKVPATFWATLSGASIALFGVLISNHGTTIRMIKQHAHERELKAKERITNIRRDVYMDSISAVNHAMSFLGGMAERDPSKDNLTEPLIALNTVGSKIQLVADSGTADAAADLLNSINMLYMLKLAELQPICACRLDEEECQAHADFAHKQFWELKDRIDALLKTENADKSLLSSLSADRDAHYEVFSQHRKERDIVAAHRLHLQREFSLSTLKEVNETKLAQIALISRMRVELELEPDIEALTKRMASTVGKSEDALQAVYTAWSPTAQA